MNNMEKLDDQTATWVLLLDKAILRGDKEEIKDLRKYLQHTKILRRTSL